MVANKFIQFVMKYAKDNNMKYNDALKSKKVKMAYDKSKGVSPGKKGAASKTMKGKEDFTTKKGGMRKTARKAFEKKK